LFTDRAHGGRVLSTDRRIGIVYRCVSANRSGRAAARFIAGPVSGNRLSAGCPGTRCHSTSAPGTRGTPETPGIALRRPASPGLPRLRAVFRRPRGVRRPSTGVAAADAAGDVRVPLEPFRRCGVRRRSTNALSAVGLRGLYAPRGRVQGAASSRVDPPPAAFRPPASPDLRAPRSLVPRIASPRRCLLFKQPNGSLLHRASPSMRCPRAG
jgi:hypothetical protein